MGAEGSRMNVGLIYLNSFPYPSAFIPAVAPAAQANDLLCGKPTLRSRATEEQDVTVGVLELEAAQTVMSILEWFREFDISRRKLSVQRLRIRNIEISVPASCRVPPIVREWIYLDTLEHDHCATAAHNAKEKIVARYLKGDLKAKPV